MEEWSFKMKSFKDLWKWLDGKMTAMCLIYWCVIILSMILIFPKGFNGFSLALLDIVASCGLLISIIALIRSAIKHIVITFK
jgi:hypothetical protein